MGAPQATPAQTKKLICNASTAIAMAAKGHKNVESITLQIIDGGNSELYVTFPGVRRGKTFKLTDHEKSMVIDMAGLIIRMK